MNEPTICPIPLQGLSPAVRKAADPTTAVPARMMAARGMAPMAPKDLVTVQFILTFDPDAKIQEAAKKSLSNLDPRLANAVLPDTSLSEHVLGYLGRALAQRDADIEKLLLNPSTPNWAFVTVAEVCSEQVCEIIANNQARVLAFPDIARGLIKNARALKSTIDRVVDFLVRSNIVLDGVGEFEQALLRLTGEDRLKAADSLDVPLELIDEQYLSDEQRAALGQERRLIGESEDEDGEVENEKIPIEQILKGMTTGQKVAFATKGNKSVRSRLLRDTNRIVAIAAVTAPAFTENEAVSAAMSRTVHADVIAYISRHKEWLKNYQIKLALAQNPKCPLPTAMKITGNLQRKDLKILSTSKNVPAGVRNLALKMTKSQGA